MKKVFFTLFLFICPFLSAEMKVLALSGSTRTDSYNKMLVQDAAKIARGMGATVTIIDLKDYPMPYYDRDVEVKGMPKNVKKFRDLMVQSDAVIISTPEYNASVPAVLKNALDWASRSEDGKHSNDAFEGKRFALMSASPGKGGGARALAHLRVIIEDVDGTVVEDQVSITQAHKYFSQKDRAENPQLKAEIAQLLGDKDE
jgi:chromate reductase, NAD(P)H dehydrogenase (quinone)